jgi:L-threonylcarbamoyladenylate synthase
MPELIRIDAISPAPAALGRIIDILKSGDVIAYPTETFYGLGADAFNPAAVDRIFDVKGRDQKNPIPLIIGRIDFLEKLVIEIPGSAASLVGKFWPGPLTLVFRAAPSVNPALTGGSGKIGIRLSSHPLARILSEGISGPLTATSANLSGAGECVSAAEVVLGLDDRISTVVDGGNTPGGKGSTVLDITADPPKILRHGAVPAEAILDTLGRTA